MVSTKVAEGFVELSIDLRGLNQGLARARKSFTRSLGNIQKSADRVGKRLSIALTAPLLAAGIASGKVAGTFEINMAKITGLVGIAADQVDLLGAAVLKLVPQVGKGPVELSKALFTITSAGARGQKALDLLEISAKGATAGLGETEDVAKAAASAMQAFASDNLTAAQTVSTLVNIVKEGNLEGRDLASTFSRVTPFAAALGIALNEAGAAMAVISLTAPDASASATQLEALLRSLGRSTPILEEALQKLGLSFEGVRKQLQQDGLLATLRNLQERASATGTRLSELFVDSSALAGAMGILNIDAGRVDRTFKALANTVDTDVNDAFLAVAGTSAFKFIQAMVSIQTAATQLGQVILPILAPIITKIAAAVTTAGNAFSELNPELQNTILGGLALAAALGPALIVFGLMVGAMSSILSALIVLTSGFAKFAVLAVTSIVSVIGALFSVPTAVLLAAGAFVIFRKTIGKIFTGIGDKISLTFKLAFEESKAKFADLINAIISGINSLPDIFGFTEIEFRVGRLDETELQKIRDRLEKFSDDLPISIGEQFAADLKTAEDSVRSGFEKIKNIISGAIDIPSFDAILDKFPELAGKFKEAVSEIGTAIDEAAAKLAGGVDKAGSKAKSVFESIKDVAEDVSGSISSSITSVITGATSALDALRNVANQIIGSIISSLVGSPGGGGFLGSLFGSAKGNVFEGGSPVPFADGGIIGGRTVFPLGNGGTGLAGEAGKEGILPLSRVAGGKLGVSAEGLDGGGVVINQTNNFSVDVRPTVQEELANAAPILINAAKQATLAALAGRRV